MPKAKPGEPTPRPLADLSVKDMHEYIAWLEAEAMRVKTEIERRGNVKSAAEALFS